MNIISPLEQFEIIPLVQLNVGYVDFSITNATLAMFYSTGAFILLIALISQKVALIPNRWQYIIENMVLFVLTMVIDNVGTRGQKYLSFIFTLFVFILCCNLLGMIPYSYTVTSQLIITFCLALAVFIGVNIIIISEHKLEAFGLFLPPGSPMILAPMLVLIEMISYFIRVVSLSVRLFANLMSGHILLKVLLGFAYTMATGGLFLCLFHLVPLAIVFLLIGLEFCQNRI